MRDRRRSGPGYPAPRTPSTPSVHLARLVSHPHRSPVTESAERKLRASLRRRLWDGFERGKCWVGAWETAWAESSAERTELLARAPELRTREEDYRELLSLDWRRWRGH